MLHPARCSRPRERAGRPASAPARRSATTMRRVLAAEPLAEPDYVSVADGDDPRGARDDRRPGPAVDGRPLRLDPPHRQRAAPVKSRSTAGTIRSWSAPVVSLRERSGSRAPAIERRLLVAGPSSGIVTQMNSEGSLPFAPVLERGPDRKVDGHARLPERLVASPAASRRQICPLPERTCQRLAHRGVDDRPIHLTGRDGGVDHVAGLATHHVPDLCPCRGAAIGVGREGAATAWRASACCPGIIPRPHAPPWRRRGSGRCRGSSATSSLISSIFSRSAACVFTSRSWTSDATVYVSSRDERREQVGAPDRLDDGLARPVAAGQHEPDRRAGVAVVEVERRRGSAPSVVAVRGEPIRCAVVSVRITSSRSPGHDDQRPRADPLEHVARLHRADRDAVDDPLEVRARVERLAAGRPRGSSRASGSTGSAGPAGCRAAGCRTARGRARGPARCPAAP